MYSGDSLSTFRGVFLIPLAMLETKLLEVVESKRTFDVCEEIYSVRRRKDTPESADFGLPRDANGLRRDLSCG